MNNYLILNTSTLMRRRVGISRWDRRQRPMPDAAQETSSPSKSNSRTSPNTTMRGHESDSEIEENLFRMPDSDDSDPERENRVAINPSFSSKQKYKKDSPTKSSTIRTRNGAKEQDSSDHDRELMDSRSFSQARVTKGLGKTTRARLVEGKTHGSIQDINVAESQNSSQTSTSGSPKRKIDDASVQDEKKDLFGQNKLRRKRSKLTYSKLSKSTLPLKSSSTNQASPDLSPAKKHKSLDELDSFSPPSQEKKYPVHRLSSLSPIPDTPASNRKIKLLSTISTPAVKSEDEHSFKALGDGEFDDSPTSSPNKSPRSEVEHFQLTQLPDFNALDDSLMDDPLELPTKRSSKSEDEQLPLIKRPAFKDLDVNTLGLTETARAVLEEDKDLLSRPLSDDDDPCQKFRCLMCHHVLNPEEFQKITNMNTRMQERACETHQKKFAKEDWKTNGYPSINWKKLDQRIDEHHAFIKKLIRGANCPYRSLLKEKVDNGEDRNAKNSTMITPGYYGGRGRQVISNNIMNGFTSLLSKRTVKDELISARGMTGFVQCVIMPEVAVHLIMEDMNMNDDEARNVLLESASIGELVNPDIKDRIKRRIEDSDDEHDY